MIVNTGDILHVYCDQVSDYKYVVCVCPKELRFFLINTHPRRISPDAQVLIKQSDYPSFLKHDSYINTAYMVQIPQSDLNKGTPLTTLQAETKEEIMDTVNQSRHISPNDRNLTISRFTPT